MTTTYGYDGDGNRIQSTTSGGADLRYTWDVLAETGVPEIAVERAPSTGSLVRRYLTTPVGAASMTTSSATYYYHHDPAGSVTDQTNASGTAQWLYQYDPYGAPRTTTNVSGTAPENRLQYDSQYTDPETGLYDLRARMYNPTTGTFGAVDPLAASASGAAFGTYSYASANPLLYDDPLGLLSFGDFKDGLKHAAGKASDMLQTGVSTVGNTAVNSASYVADKAVDGGEWVYNHPAEAARDALTVASFVPVPWVAGPARLALIGLAAYDTANAYNHDGLGTSVGLNALGLLPGGGKVEGVAAKIMERCPRAQQYLEALRRTDRPTGQGLPWGGHRPYAPNRDLPRYPGGRPKPESGDPHTQLGTRKGLYPQSREFDANGRPVRDIDWTDHGQPDWHTDPHQHLYGSDGSRGDAASVWR